MLLLTHKIIVMNYYKTLATLFLIIVTAVSCNKEKNTITASTDYIRPNDFLSANRYKTLIVEVDYMNGYQPTQAAIDNAVDFLLERLNKPKGIKVVLKNIPALNKNTYTISDIKNIELVNRNHYPAAEILTAYVLFLDGGYIQDNQNTKILGVSYSSTAVAIFEETIKNYSGGVTQPSQTTLETAVINHEFGHTLGLINNGTPLQSQHQDINHGHHCNDSDCLMYYTAETSDIVGNLVGGNIPELDDNCIADLRANGGK